MLPQKYLYVKPIVERPAAESRTIACNERHERPLQARAGNSALIPLAVSCVPARRRPAKTGRRTPDKTSHAHAWMTGRRTGAASGEMGESGRGWGDGDEHHYLHSPPVRVRACTRTHHSVDERHGGHPGTRDQHASHMRPAAACTQPTSQPRSHVTSCEADRGQPRALCILVHTMYKTECVKPGGLDGLVGGDRVVLVARHASSRTLS